MKIVHTDGEWFQNTGMFRFTDPTTGAVFEPNIPTKAKSTSWIASQPTIKKIADPLTKPTPTPVTAQIPLPPEVKKPVKK
jgi:hypothetical protein